MFNQAPDLSKKLKKKEKKNNIFSWLLRFWQILRLTSTIFGTQTMHLAPQKLKL